MRLLFCKFCKTLEELDDFDGPPEADVLLNTLVMKHNVRDPMKHGGEETLPLSLMYISEKTWAEEKDDVIKQINMEHKATGFDGWVYESMSTYKEDALRCYSAHHRPKDGCIDWWAESKRIGRPTEEGQKAIRDMPGLGDYDPHLCQYCPVATYVQTEIRHKQGAYKDG